MKTSTAFTLSCLLSFLCGMIIMGVILIEPEHEPATLAPIESDETHTGGVYIPGAEGATITPNTIGPKYDSVFSFKGATVEIQEWQPSGIYYDETKKKLIYVDNLGREFQIEATLQKVKLK